MCGKRLVAICSVSALDLFDISTLDTRQTAHRFKTILFAEKRGRNNVLFAYRNPDFNEVFLILYPLVFPVLLEDEMFPQKVEFVDDRVV